MIAVAKSLLGGLATATGSASKKDGETAPFAETFQQIAAARETQAAVSQRVTSGGRKDSDSLGPNSGNQTLAAGSPDLAPTSEGAANDGKGSQFADSTNEQAADGFESGAGAKGLAAQPANSLLNVPGPPIEGTQQAAVEGETAVAADQVGSSVPPVVSASSGRIVSPSQPADGRGEASRQVDVSAKQYAVRQSEQKINGSSVALPSAIATAISLNKNDGEQQGAEPAVSQAATPTTAMASVQTLPEMTYTKGEPSEAVIVPTATTTVPKSSSITSVAGASHRAASSKTTASSDVAASTAGAPVSTGTPDSATILSLPVATGALVQTASRGAQNESGAESVTPVVTGGLSGSRALTTSKQNIPSTITSQAQEGGVDMDTTKPVPDPATAAIDTDEVKAGNESSLLAAAESLVKSVQQRGAVTGNTPTAKERKAIASAEGTVATETSAPMGGSHNGTTSALSPSIPVEHQAVTVGGAETTAIPATAIVGAAVATQPQLSPTTHVAANPASLTASADALATTQAVPTTLTAADHGLSPLAHTTLSATPTVLEIGVPSGTQGWLKIRAEIGEGGVVQASVSASTHAGQDALTRDLPAMSAFLESEHVPVNLQLAHAANSGAAALANATSTDSSLGSGLGQSLQQNASSSGGSGQNETASGMPAGGSGDQGGERQRDASGGFTATGSGTLAAPDVTAASGSDWVAPAGYGNGSLLNGGSWLNVIA